MEKSVRNVHSNIADPTSLCQVGQPVPKSMFGKPHKSTTISFPKSPNSYIKWQNSSELELFTETRAASSISRRNGSPHQLLSSLSHLSSPSLPTPRTPCCCILTVVASVITPTTLALLVHHRHRQLCFLLSFCCSSFDFPKQA